jgi:hypothetical protein
MMRPSDHVTTKLIHDAHVELLRGRRRPVVRKSPRAN